MGQNVIYVMSEFLVTLITHFRFLIDDIDVCAKDLFFVRLQL